MNKLDELIELLKVNAGLSEKKQKKKCNGVACVLGVVAAIAAVGAAIYAAYRYFGPSYLEDFDDDYEDDYDDDFFEDEDDDTEDEQTASEGKKDTEEPAAEE